MGKRGRDSSSSSSSDSEEEHHKKKKEKEHKKEHRKKKHKKEKSKKRERGGEEDLVRQAKAFLEAQLGASGAGPVASEPGPLPAPTLKEELRISADDYFLKSAEFTAWLQEERRVFFNELTTEQSHALFDQFVALWNADKLPQKYYASQVAAPVKRTSHVWAFQKGGAAGGSGSSNKGVAAFLDDQKAKQGDARALEQLEKRKWRANQKDLLDELLPKATGREAQVEKRIARREEAKAREASPDHVRLPGGGDVYGGDDSIEAAKAREARRVEAARQRQLLRAEETAAKAAAFQAKEDEKMQAFKALLQKGPITIAKRQ